MTKNDSLNNADQHRRSLIESLILLDRPFAELEKAISKYPFDYEGSPVPLVAAHVKKIVKRVRNGELSMADAKAWANAVEIRDDIKISAKNRNKEKSIFDAIFLISSPELSGLKDDEILRTAEKLLETT